jgi:hypothetical protein
MENMSLHGLGVMAARTEGEVVYDSSERARVEPRERPEQGR